MSTDQANWRENILKSLRERDGRETKDFEELILLRKLTSKFLQVL